MRQPGTIGSGSSRPRTCPACAELLDFDTSACIGCGRTVPDPGLRTEAVLRAGVIGLLLAGAATTAGFALVPWLRSRF